MTVLEVLNKIGYTDFIETQTNYCTRPLYRASDNNTALTIDKTTGKWYDFVEKRGGDLHQLVQLTTKDMSEEAIAEQFGDLASTKDRYELEHIKKFDKFLLVKLKKDHAYWLDRGVSTQTIETFEGGTAFNGRMAFRYVFPIFDERDDLIGFSGRRLTDNKNFPKWKHLGSKSNWLYPARHNAGIIRKLKQVVLVESIGDMLTLWDNNVKNVLVTFGLSLSPAITQFLIKIDVGQIVIALNNDENNNSAGNEAALDMQQRLRTFFDYSQMVIGMPEEAKDFGEMDRSKISLWKTKYQIRSL